MLTEITMFTSTWYLLCTDTCILAARGHHIAKTWPYLSSILGDQLDKEGFQRCAETDSAAYGLSRDGKRQQDTSLPA